MALVDNCGRPLLNLRIAVTQRCNLKCSYCHREGEVQRVNASEEKMTVEEIVRIARLAVELGIGRVKLTGGEPLMRADLCDIIRGISAIPKLRDLSISTNGALLFNVAKELYDSGLKRVNISLPSLNPEKYHKLTGGNLKDVLAGIKGAIEAHFFPVKLNMVVLNNINETEISTMIDYARQMDVILQLIELDPVNVSSNYYLTYHRNLEDQEAILTRNAINIATRRFMHNRRIYQLKDVTVEVVHPIENREFCMHCTRMRVTSDGKLKPCLMKNDNLVDILSPLRKGASDEELKHIFIRSNMQREPYNRSY